MDSKRKARRIAAFIAAALLTVAACGANDDDAAPAASNGNDTVPETVEVAPVEIDGQPLGPMGESNDPALGQPVPGLSGTAIDGSPLAWAPGERPAAIVFLAHWCPACQAEVVELTEWLDAGNKLPEGVDLLSIVTRVDSERDNYPPSRWLADEAWPFPALVDSASSEIAVAFGQAGTPFWVFAFADGTLATRGSGRILPDDLARLFDQLLAQAEG